MAHSAKLNNLTDELVSSIIKFHPRTETSNGSTEQAKAFKSARDQAYRKLKAQQYGRVNQFDVHERYDGLEEKFIALNREDLAAGLSERLAKLRRETIRYLPEALFLLLELSDKPVEKSTVADLKFLKSPTPPPTLTWSDIIADDPLNEEDIWIDIDYKAVSSEDEEILSPRPARKGKQRAKTIGFDDIETPVALERILEPHQDVNLDKIKSAQFWRSTGLTEHLTELQAIREILFMLLGLPCSLFRYNSDGDLVPSANVSMSHILPSTLRHILKSFAQIGARIDFLRKWLSKDQEEPFVQTFQASIEQLLFAYSSKLIGLQQQFVTSSESVVISVIDLYGIVEKDARSSLAAASLLVNQHSDLNKKPFALIENLFQALVFSQTSGDSDVFFSLGRVFFDVLNTYLRPVQEWMREGVLDRVNNPFFFIVEISGNTDNKEATKQSLWHNHYMLVREASGMLRAPAFIHSAAQKILNTGKSVVFLKELFLFQKDYFSKEVQPRLHLENVCGIGGMPLIPFEDLFEASFHDWIQSKYSTASSVLRNSLFDQCGLLRTLDALDVIYLGKDTSFFQTFADDLFARMERFPNSWNDKYSLTDLAQSVYATCDVVDPYSISVKATSPIDPPKGDVLDSLSRLFIDYKVFLSMNGY
jgi:gamma-tubulin complex component 5